MGGRSRVKSRTHLMSFPRSKHGGCCCFGLDAWKRLSPFFFYFFLSFIVSFLLKRRETHSKGSRELNRSNESDVKGAYVFAKRLWSGRETWEPSLFRGRWTCLKIHSVPSNCRVENFDQTEDKHLLIVLFTLMFIHLCPSSVLSKVVSYKAFSIPTPLFFFLFSLFFLTQV